jgi:hypothetical protein
VAEAGRGEDLTFAYDRMTRTPNTLDAHRLLWLADRLGVQDAVAESLFHGYENRGVNCSFVFETWKYVRGQEQEYRRKLVLRQQPLVMLAGILAAPVRVRQQPSRGRQIHPTRANRAGCKASKDSGWLP